MTTCDYAHIVLSGFLSSIGVIALIMLKFELFIWSSAKPTRFFHVDQPKDVVLVG